MPNSRARRASNRDMSALAVLLLVLWALPATAADEAIPAGDCAEVLARRVQSHYEGVRDLTARFVQTQRSVAFTGGEEEARGEVFFAKPGRMRWSYESPEPSLVVSDGEKLWIYDPVAREVQVLAVDQGFLSGAAFQFLLGEGRILEAYRASARGCGEERTVLELVPRAESTYERLELTVDPSRGTVHATSVVDLFGNRTDVVFEDVRANQGLGAELFRFEPPAGVRVLTLPGP